MAPSYSWESLSHAPYSPGREPNDFHLFASMGDALFEQRFSFRKCEKWINDWFQAKAENVFGVAFTDCHKDEKIV